MRITSGGPGFIPLVVRRNSHRSILLFPLFLLLLLISITTQAQTVNIHSIQSNPTNPTLSTYYNQSVTTSGVVIGILSSGFYIENKQADWSTPTAGTEGIFVSTNGVTIPAGTVALHNELQVAGTVVLSTPTSATSGLQINLSAAPTVLNTGVAFPQAISLDTNLPASAANYQFGQFLKFQGMLATLTSVKTVSATGGTLDEPTETVTSSGQFYAVAPTLDRTFRQTGFSPYDIAPTGAPNTIPTWTGNPQRFLIDSASLGGTPLDVTVGETVTALSGIVDYRTTLTGTTNETALLLFSSGGYSTHSGAMQGAAARTPVSGELTVATQDLGRFFYTSKTASAAISITPDAYARRLAKAAASIVNYENAPDIVAVQEAENEQTLLDLSAAVSRAASAAGKTDPTYSVLWLAGNDTSGLANGVLFNPAKVQIPAAEQYGQNLTYTAPSGTTYSLFDRPPFVLHVKVTRAETDPYPDSATKSLIVVINNLLDRTKIDDAATGDDVRHRRQAQAEYVAEHVIQTFQDNSESVISVGNYNAFEHEVQDGYVDVMGTIDGNPVAANLVTLSSLPNLTTPNALNLTSTAQAAQRYTYIEGGNSEQLDHIVISSDLAVRSSVDYARVNADFPAANLNATGTPLHNADHDPVIGYFVIPQHTNITLTSSENPSYVGDSVTFTATVSSPAGGPPTGTISFYIDNQLVSTVTLDSTLRATYTTASLAVGSHPVKAVYSGDLAHDPATASLVQVVVAYIPTVTTLACSPNPAQYGTTVTCTASVTSGLANHVGPTTGTITFYDGTTTLGTVNLSGSAIASLSTSALKAGLHPITAVYARNPPYDTSTSNTVNELIWADFSISVSPSSGSIYTGEKANFTVTITPGAGFTFDTPLSCSNLPDYSSCTFTPNPVPNSSGKSTWIIQTSAPSQSATVNRQSGFPWQMSTGSIGLAAIALFFLPKRFRRRGAFLALLFVLTFHAILGCSAPRRLTGGTTPGTYTVTVTASVDESGYVVSHSANVTLTVKSLF